MMINSKPIKIKFLLKCAGYKPLPNTSLMKEDAEGRFHAYIFDRFEAEIHYDLYVDKVTKRHFSPHMPIHHNRERRRLMNLSSSIQKCRKKN